MLDLDFRSRKPIYEQICEKIKEMIAIGELKDGDQLPAVRVLAKDIGINHNTIQKAFSLLEREGIIYSVAGKGSFVDAGASKTDQFRQKALGEIALAIEKNLIYQITLNDIHELAAGIFEKNKPAAGERD